MAHSDEVSAADVDTFFLLQGAVLVFFMQAGFAMLEVGSINVLNLRVSTETILIKNMMDVSLGAVCWWVLGYGFAYGDSRGSDGFVGASNFFLRTRNFDDDSDDDGDDSGSGYPYAEWLMSWAFAATSATIVSGAVAERCTAVAYMTYTICLTALVYPVLACWVWNADGWLNPARAQGPPLLGCGAMDFAGSGVVHVTGGLAAFIGATIVGPRKAFVQKNLKTPMYGPIFQTIGTFVLWLGWFGFNGMSSMTVVGRSQVAARAMMNTAISGATAGICAGVLGGVLDKADVTDGRFYVKFTAANNGVLGGLVAVTAGCALMEPYAAFLVGALSAPVSVLGSRWLKRPGFLRGLIGIDDVVDATPIHGMCGVLGVVAPACFATPKMYAQTYGVSGSRADRCAGIFYGGSGESLAASLIFLAALVAWVALLVSAVFQALSHKLILRVSIALEDVGLDDSAHGAHHLEYDTGLAQPHSMGGAAAAAAQQRDLELFGGSEVDNISSSTSSYVLTPHHQRHHHHGPRAANAAPNTPPPPAGTAATAAAAAAATTASSFSSRRRGPPRAPVSAAAAVGGGAGAQSSPSSKTTAVANKGDVENGL